MKHQDVRLGQTVRIETHRIREEHKGEPVGFTGLEGKVVAIDNGSVRVRIPECPVPPVERHFFAYELTVVKEPDLAADEDAKMFPRTSQCPLCFYLAPLPGFVGICPSCKQDTLEAMRRLRGVSPEKTPLWEFSSEGPSNCLALYFDNAVSPEELKRWQTRVITGTQSTGLTEADVQDTELYRLARSHAGSMELIHCLLFNIVEGHDTELHQDVGEWVVLFYPYDCPTGPLRIRDKDGEIRDIEVKANRLVLLDCTSAWHQQVVPTDGSTRFSVAFKFRLPVAS
jgi:hypothetical protein